MRNSTQAWAEVSVAEIAAQSAGAIAIGPFGSRMKSDTYSPSGVPVVRGNNLGPTPSFVGGFVFVPPEFARTLGNANVFKGDLVFPHRGSIGEVGIVPEGHFVLSTSLMKLSVDQTKADPLFLFYFFRSPKGRHELLKNASQVGTPGIATPLTSLRSVRLLLPPLPEQRAIAHILGTLDDKIELNRRMNQTLEAIAQALFKEWFIDPGQDALPKGWRITEVGSIVECVGGATPSTKGPSFWDGPHSWTSPKDLASLEAPFLLSTPRTVTDAGLKQISSGLNPAGTLLLSSRAPVGYLAIATIPVAVNQGYIAMRCNSRATNYFMLNWCQANMETIKSRATGTTFPEISKQNFRPIPVKLPPEPLMADFTNAVSPVYDRIASNLKESRTLAQLRDALLPKLLSGEIRVRAAEKLTEVLA